MIIPAVGYVPDWMIALPVCVVGSLLTLLNLKFRGRLSRFERSFNILGAQIAVWFTWISTKVRSAQVDTLNRDVMMMAVGILLVFVISIFYGGAAP